MRKRRVPRCSLPVPLAGQVVVASRGDLFFGDDQGGGRDGLQGLDGWIDAERLEVGGEFGLGLRKVVLVDRPALGAGAEAVVLDFEEGDGGRLFRECSVEDENARD